MDIMVRLFILLGVIYFALEIHLHIKGLLLIYEARKHDRVCEDCGQQELIDEIRNGSK
jgi:hypothetical protein